MGSKSRHAKYMLPIILKDRKPGQWYVEPFVGGANMIDKVDGNRIGSDLNKYLISLLNQLQQGWLPPYIDEEMYIKIKNNKDKYDDFLLGYVGFQLSYGATWFGSYRKDSIGKRDYSIEAYNNLKKQAPKLKGIIFLNKTYDELEIPENSIVYCDPPYENTAKYNAVEDFHHKDFWNWCNNLVEKGHKVFVSEYNAPNDWECVWQREVNSSLTKNTGSKKAIEKLFTKTTA